MYLTTIHNPRKAYYYLIGEYQILKNRIDLTYKLITPQYMTLNTFVISFLLVAYKNYEIEPKTISFDKLIRTGVVVSGDLRADITTNIGKKDLLFKSGKSFRLLVKMNKLGFFYIVVHALKEGETYSYLIDFFNENRNRKFIYHVNADDVNRWIELGEFEIVPPFGIETLQMMASDQDLIDKVPPNFHD